MPSIVLTNWVLNGRTGTELYVRDLAFGLKKRGWSPSIFTLRTGPLAEELREAGIPVLTRPEELPRDVALVHGHHNFMTVMALLACRRARGIFVCHASLFWQEEPPVFPRILKYVGVDDPCRERVAADLKCPVDEVRFIGNSVDLTRFTPRAPLPPKPKRALVFSNYAAEYSFLPVVREACQRAGLALDVVGSGVSNQVSEPERVLKEYDIVFAKARCAMESLATGCATVLCGPEGVGPLVTMENFDRLRRDNFGRRCLSLPMEVEHLIAGVGQYEAAVCNEVGRHARRELDLKHVLDQWVALYEEVLALPLPDNTGADAESLAAARMLAKLDAPLFRVWEFDSVRDHLQHQVEKLTREKTHMEAQFSAPARLREELERAKAERQRYRSERDAAREKARDTSGTPSITLKGPLAWLWRHRALRPIARLLGVRGRSASQDRSS